MGNVVASTQARSAQAYNPVTSKTYKYSQDMRDMLRNVLAAYSGYEE